MRPLFDVDDILKVENKLYRVSYVIDDNIRVQGYRYILDGSKHTLSITEKELCEKRAKKASKINTQKS